MNTWVPRPPECKACARCGYGYDLHEPKMRANVEYLACPTRLRVFEPGVTGLCARCGSPQASHRQGIYCGKK